MDHFKLHKTYLFINSYLSNYLKKYLFSSICLLLLQSFSKGHEREIYQKANEIEVRNQTLEAQKMTCEKNNQDKILIAAGILFFTGGVTSIYGFRKRKQVRRRFDELVQKKETILPLPNNVDLSDKKNILDENEIQKIENGLAIIENRSEYIHPNFKLTTVAKKINTNTSYLSTYLNQHRQKTFSEYVQELRMNYIIEKLKESSVFRNYTLQAIAEEIGYKNADTFVRIFKKHTGLSPNYFIKKLKEQPKNP